MNRFLKTTIATIGLATILNANPLFLNQDVNDEFSKMQAYFNSMLNSKFFNNNNNIQLENLNYPKVDIQEKNDEYILKFELAGFEKDDLKLSLQENAIVLEGKKENKKDDKNDSYIRQEIFFGKFKRVIQLPQNVAVDKLQSKYKNGILTITIPKKEVKKSSFKILKIN